MKNASISRTFSGLVNPGPPWPFPLTTCSVTSTPAFFSASASSSLCRSGTMSSLSPCMRRNGAAFLSTYVSGLAFRAFSLFSCAGPPISRATGEPGGSPSTPIVVSSVGPNQSRTHCTRLDWSRLPPRRSHSFTPAVVPSRATRWPPAEAPQTPMWSGSRWYFAAFARSQRMAALQSSIWAGNTACWLKR